jgi:predicted hydrocarbon binding protein
MQLPEGTTMSQQGANAQPHFDGTVVAAFPLALLESMRAHDRPGEILEDEDLSVSMPRRLGLTGIVETQIFRYETARRTGRLVPMTEAMGLFRLVMRRADSEPILRETGQRMARWHFRRTPGLWQGILHRAPARFALRSARRAAVSALRSLNAGTDIAAEKPLEIRVTDCVTARLDESRPACTLFTGMIEELLLLHTGQARLLVHSRCSGTGDTVCEWNLFD